MLTAAEIGDLYGVPSFNEDYQRFYFTLNDKERADFTRMLSGFGHSSALLPFCPGMVVLINGVGDYFYSIIIADPDSDYQRDVACS